MSLPEWRISELQEKMKSGELTARQLAVLYLGQIDAVDKGGAASMIELVNGHVNNWDMESHQPLSLLLLHPRQVRK